MTLSHRKRVTHCIKTLYIAGLTVFALTGGLCISTASAFTTDIKIENPASLATNIASSNEVANLKKTLAYNERKLAEAKKKKNTADIRLWEYKVLNANNKLADLKVKGYKKKSVAGYEYELMLVRHQYHERKLAEAKKAKNQKEIKEWTEKVDRTAKELQELKKSGQSTNTKTATAKSAPTKEKQTVSNTKVESAKKTLTYNQRKLAEAKKSKNKDDIRLWEYKVLKANNELAGYNVPGYEEKSVAGYEYELMLVRHQYHQRKLAEAKKSKNKKEIEYWTEKVNDTAKELQKLKNQDKTADSQPQKSDNATDVSNATSVNAKAEDAEKFDKEMDDLVSAVTNTDQDRPVTNSCQKGGSIKYVSSDAQLKHALKNAQCGTTIMVNKGKYTAASNKKYANYILSKNCGSNAPITIASADNMEFPGSIHIRGSNLRVDGFHLKGGSIFVTGKNNTVSNNYLDKPQYVGIRLLEGVQNNNVVNNTVNGFRSRGIEIQTSTKKSGDSDYGNRVAYNLLTNAAGSGNGSEAIRVLSNNDGKSMRTLIEYNYMDRVHVDGEGEAISIKTSGNVIRNNVLANSGASSIVNRNGNNNVFDSNQIINSSGIKIFGANNKVVNNAGGKIRVFGGNVKKIGDLTSNNKGGHPHANNTYVANNSASIEVGATYSNFTYKASKTTLSGNSGKVSMNFQTGTVNKGSGSGASGRIGVAKSATGVRSGGSCGGK